MLSTVVVEVPQQCVLANPDGIAGPRRGAFLRCPGTLGTDEHAARGPHGDSERWS